MYGKSTVALTVFISLSNIISALGAETEIQQLLSEKFRGSEHVTSRCGDAPIGVWATDGDQIKDSAILRSTNDIQIDDRIYRVCNWNSSTKAKVAASKDNDNASFLLYPRSCVDFSQPIHIGVATSQSGALVYGFYCKLTK